MFARVGGKSFRNKKALSIFNILSPPLKTWKRILCKDVRSAGWEKTSPYKGGSRRKECWNVEINSRSGKTWWVIDQRSFFMLWDVFWIVCTVPLLHLQFLNVGFSCNCLVGGNEIRRDQKANKMNLQQITKVLVLRLDQTKTEWILCFHLMKWHEAQLTFTPGKF